MSHSEIARFREQQALQEEAARLALQGPAITAKHAFITARLHRGAERILCLFEQGNTSEAIKMMDDPLWGSEEEEGKSVSHYDHAQR